jgi:CspA family cold shock protein
MRSTGVVRVWHADQGWGVIDSDATPGGCWAGFASVLVPGYRALRAGESVTLEYERAEQDGYSFRAVEVWPAEQEPYRTEAAVEGPSPAYGSTLTVTWREPKDSDSV